MNNNRVSITVIIMLTIPIIIALTLGIFLIQLKNSNYFKEYGNPSDHLIAKLACQEKRTLSFCLPVHDAQGNWYLTRINAQGSIIINNPILENKAINHELFVQTLIDSKTTNVVLEKVRYFRNFCFTSNNVLTKIPIVTFNQHIALANFKLKGCGLDIDRLFEISDTLIDDST